MGGSGAGKSTLLEGLSLALPGSNVFTETHRACEIRVEPAAAAGDADTYMTGTRLPRPSASHACACDARDGER